MTQGSLRFVVAADAHQQPYAWTKYPEIAGDAYRALSQVVDQAMAGGVPLVLLGDTFDSKRPDPQSVLLFAAQVRRLAERGQPVYYVQGNHDGTSPSWCDVHPGAQSLHGRVVRLGPWRCYGLDWQPPDRLAAALQGIPPEVDILFCHQSWAEMQRIGRTDGRLADIGRPMVVFTGDYHVTTRLTVAVPGGELVVYSPGSLAMQAIDEAPQKYCVTVSDTEGNQVAAQLVPLTGRDCQRHQAMTPEGLESVVRLLEGATATAAETRPIFQVRYRADLPDAYARLTAAANPQACHLMLSPTHVVDEVVGHLPVIDHGTLANTVAAMGLPAPVAYGAGLLAADVGALPAALQRLYDDFTQGRIPCG